MRPTCSQNDEEKGQKSHNRYLHCYEVRESDGFREEDPDSNKGPEEHSGWKVDDEHRRTPVTDR